MQITPVRITTTPEWAALADHQKQLASVHLRELFANDPKRADALTIDAVDLHVDYSKHRVTEETMRLLMAVARRAGLAERITEMWAGDHINVSEDRAVLHVALRAPREERIVSDGIDVVPEVHAVLDKMAAFSRQIRSGEWLGYNGRPIRNVINIGIGG
ncbi:MAG: glucose-6-phosphate isomerase, partial [Acidimicrobiales bacterium]